MGISSIRRTDLLALSNLRNDGRKPEEIRRMRIQIGPVAKVHQCILNDQVAVSGSALVEMGLTTVLATVRGPMDCRSRSEELPDRAILDAVVKLTAFASSGDRRIANPNADRRLIEMSHMLKRAMEAAIFLDLYPRSRFELSVCIMADDGGKLCAAINAASLAVVDAGIPIKDLVCSCSAGCVGSGMDSTTLVDLNRQEESSFAGEAAVHLPCAIMPQRNTVVLAQCEARLPDMQTLDRVMEAAMGGCREVFEILQAAIREHASLMLNAQNGQVEVYNALESNG